MPAPYFRARAWTWPRADKKAEKFVNGHDARDGRWDGRGPTEVATLSQSPVARGAATNDTTASGVSEGRSLRRGDFDRGDVLLGRPNRVDRDGDGDFDSRDVLA